MANTLVTLVASMLVISCDRNSEAISAAKETSPSSVFLTTCATCHGEQGQGIKEKMTPAIAALPRWYLEEQIAKFRSGQRGNHPEDIYGQQMRVAISALNEQQITEALDSVETLPFPEHDATLSGNVERGALHYREHCMECHRFNGQGEIAFSSSPLVGLQDWYLLEQWGKFSQGVRGYHAADESGAKMRKVAGYLTDEQQIRDIMRYITTLPEK